jgi:hypothetical protein
MDPSLDMLKYPIPRNRLQRVMTKRGPNLSVNFPMIRAKAPCRIQQREKAPDTVALVQPNSFNRGLKKTPKAPSVPTNRAMIQTDAMTRTYP